MAILFLQSLKKVKYNMRKLLLLVVAFCVASISNAQEENAFKPSGEPVIKVFANWHQGFGDDDYKDESGFEATRAVLGYSYKFTPNFYSKVVVDMDNPKSGKLTEVAYLRNAYIAYKDKRLNVIFGVLGLKQFKEQESNWGYRYIYKSAMDHYKFNSSVDAGLYIKYKLFDFLSADVTLTNGEGAKSQQDIEGKYRLGGGLSASLVEGLSVRVYYDYFWASDDVAANKSQNTLALFLGYESEVFRIGAEYDMLNNYKFDRIDQRDILSVYSSVSFAKDMQVFARFDHLNARNVLKSENVALVGLDYQIIKGVKVSPNIRYVDYIDTTQKDGGYVYLNFEYKF